MCEVAQIDFNYFKRDGVCNPVPYVLLSLCLMAILNQRKTFRTGQYSPSGCK